MKFKRMGIEEDRVIKFTEREVHLVFWDDMGAEAFREWWDEEGADNFMKFIEETPYYERLKDFCKGRIE